MHFHSEVISQRYLQKCESQHFSELVASRTKSLYIKKTADITYIYILSSNLVVLCAKIGLKTKKVQKTSELTKKKSKMMVF